MSSPQPSSKPTDDSRANKDWLQVWFASIHTDMQWAKGQSWNAVQWSVILLAALFAGSQQFTVIPRVVWVIFTILLAGLSSWWLVDLHRFAHSTRETSEKLIASLTERDEYLPRRSTDQHHVKLLVAKALVVVAAALVTAIEIAYRQ